MTTTIVQFAPSPLAPFQFQADLSGPTVNAASAGPTYNIQVKWNVFGQRWYIEVIDQNGTRVLTKPLVASPIEYPINMLAGYFASSLVFLDGTQQFIVTT